jgi:hypothetical protein
MHPSVKFYKGCNLAELLLLLGAISLLFSFVVPSAYSLNSTTIEEFRLPKPPVMGIPDRLEPAGTR